MKGIALIVSAISAIGLYANDLEIKDYSPVHPSKMAEFNAKTGGLVNPPDDNKVMVFLDARTADRTSIDNLSDAASSHIGFRSEVRPAIAVSAVEAFSKAKEVLRADAGAVVVFYENEKEPTLSVYPEDAITLVNVKPLYSSDYPTYRRRLVKEFWRSISFTLGGYACGGTLGSVMQPAFSIADLDAIGGFSIPPPQLGVINSVRPSLKLYNTLPVPYSRACREGWAPAPTNEVQKALFEKFSNPKTRFNVDFPANPLISAPQTK